MLNLKLTDTSLLPQMVEEATLALNNALDHDGSKGES